MLSERKEFFLSVLHGVLSTWSGSSFQRLPGQELRWHWGDKAEREKDQVGRSGRSCGLDASPILPPPPSIGGLDGRCLPATHSYFYSVALLIASPTEAATLPAPAQEEPWTYHMSKCRMPYGQTPLHIWHLWNCE